MSKESEAIVVAVKAAQLVMSKFRPITVDGYWGSFTQGTYGQLSPDQRFQVDGVLSNVAGVTASGLFAQTRNSKASRDKVGFEAKQIARDVRATNGVKMGTLVSPSDMSDIIGKVSSKTGVSSATLQRFVDLEAARIVKNGVRYYDAGAVNSGGYRGLCQFDRAGAAWASASKMGDLPPFETSWADPMTAMLAAAYYVLFNTRVIRTLGYKGIVTGSIAYLMHNQGASGAYALLSGRNPSLLGKQSGPAKAVAQIAMSEYSSQRTLA